MGENQPLVSVIIPVYKVERYLNECVDSVRNQTYCNLEIILVDDGSPDRCGEMCDRYASSDSRIKVIHQENKGVAEARNAGLRLAKGAYLFFVDSDDIVVQTAIQDMVNIACESGADMVCSECHTIDEAGHISENVHREKTTICMNMEQALRYYATAEWAPWNRLVKSKVHQDIFFPNYRIHEDEAIKFHLLERCEKVIHFFSPTYLYRQRSFSITSAESEVDRIDAFISRMESLQYLKINHAEIVPTFLPKVCEAALYNVSLLTKKGHTSKDPRLRGIVRFFRERRKEILHCPNVSKAQKLRCVLIVCSNWKRNPNLYIRMCGFLAEFRKKKG